MSRYPLKMTLGPNNPKTTGVSGSLGLDSHQGAGRISTYCAPSLQVSWKLRSRSPLSRRQLPCRPKYCAATAQAAQPQPLGAPGTIAVEGQQLKVRLDGLPPGWTLVGCGNYAAVVVHPDDAELVVKVYAPGRDQGIPMEGVEALIAREHPTTQIFVYDANHGFNSDRRKDYHEESSELARQRTLGLFRACA